MRDKQVVRGRTGQAAETLGSFETACECRRQVALSEGEVFPACPNCNADTDWSLVETVAVEGAAVEDADRA